LAAIRGGRRRTQLTVQQEALGPGEQVDGGQSQLQPYGVDGEVAGGEPADAGGLAAADAVLDAGVRAVTDLTMLQRNCTAGSVGEEGLMAHAVVKVEQ
jgi:hypothetical protein